MPFHARYNENVMDLVQIEPVRRVPAPKPEWLKARAPVGENYHDLKRLARSLGDLLSIVEKLREAGASLVALDQGIDTATAAGMAFLQMLGVFAEFERTLILERQRAGIAAARAAGRSLGGRPVVIPRSEVVALLAGSVSAKEISRRLKISKASVYRIMNEGAN